MSDANKPFTGKVAFITGAARGQGRSHALRLAESGADIVAVDICAQIASVPYPMATAEDLAETVGLVEATGRRIVARTADVRDLDALTAAVDAGVAELGRLDVVAANAGIVSPARIDELTAEAWRDVVDVDLTGVWFTVKAALPHLRAGGGGSIVLTSSTAGLKAHPGIAHYIAAKHGVTGLMRALALELAPEGIRVNSIHPGGVGTEMLLNDHMKRLFVPDRDEVTGEEFATVAESLTAMSVPWVEPADISNALLFLASDEARYVTATALPVDGGSAAL